MQRSPASNDRSTYERLDQRTAVERAREFLVVLDVVYDDRQLDRTVELIQQHIELRAAIVSARDDWRAVVDGTSYTELIRVAADRLDAILDD